MTPEAYYRQQVDQGKIIADSEQSPVVAILQDIYMQLPKQGRGLKWLRWLLPKAAVKGLYLWGSVGVGKTFLLDCFYASYPDATLRMHFHIFLKNVHEQLRDIQGQPNPLRIIAKKIARGVRVICFDEFFVDDIGDAMLLGELFQYLFAQKICLIATSNIAPDHLYRDGLQRERFIPVIEAIKHHTHVYHIVSDHDYRQSPTLTVGLSLRQIEAFFTPCATTEPITLLGRNIAVCKRAEYVIWFHFNAICGVPRSQLDYIELVKNYHTIYVSEVPIFKKNQLNLVTAFINLVDIVYDAKARLIISTTEPISHFGTLYPHEGRRVAFARTASRLTAMQAL